MKKLFRRKSSSVAPQVEPNLTDMINKMQQQLVLLEKKLDILISKSSERPSQTREPSRGFQRFNQPRRYDEGKRENSFRERTFTKVICADCKKECEVPFKPSTDRPVYCRECFAKHKSTNSFHEKKDNRRKEENPYQEHNLDKERGTRRQKTDVKKKSAFRKR